MHIRYFLSSAEVLNKNCNFYPKGTEAWIDALGYLRQKDYIADNQGYRILKSKTVFVGVNRPIQVNILTTNIIIKVSVVNTSILSVCNRMPSRKPKRLQLRLEF